MADIGASNWNEVDAFNSTAAPDGWPEGMAPSGVNDSGRAVMGAVKRVFDSPRRLRAAQCLGRLMQRPLVRDGSIGRLPPPLRNWTKARDLRPVARESFRDWWRRTHP